MSIPTALAITAVALLAVVGLDTVIGVVITRYTRWRRQRVPIDPNVSETITHAVAAFERNLREERGRS